MKILIQSPEYLLDEKMNGFIMARLEHLEKMYHRINCCDVIIRKEKNNRQKDFNVQVKLEVPEKQLLVAADRAESIELALGQVIEKLEIQLRRFKQELSDRH